jgi:CDP-Glycerol:Poly(glycerophosphate) glycerophosphotransferase
MIRRILLVAAALAAAIATVTHWSVLMLAVVLYCATVLLALRSRAVRRGGDADQTGAAIVISVATGIVVLHADPDALSLWAVATVLALLHGLHLLRHVLRVLVARRWRSAADWRNVTVASPTPQRVEPVAGPTLVPIPVWIAAPIFAIFDVDPIVYLLLGVASIALVIVTLIPVSRALLHNLRMPSETARLAALTAALRETSPEILVHFNARTRSAYAITDWMTVLEQLNHTHPVVILTVDRQPWHFDTIAATSIPLVHLVGAEAIEHFVEQLPTLALALYPRNTSPNKNLLRVPGLYDVYIGHGDSDKAEAVNPATRAFDELWIAGEAARTRYLSANVGVREEQLRIVGRPQIGELLDLAQSVSRGPRKSVVYAPTWEGYYADDGYSSVVTYGADVLTALLSLPNVAVTYLPHPALGTLNRQFALASDHLVSRLRRARGSSVIAGSLTERYAVLAAADVLVADVGSDIVDFLALDRPSVLVGSDSIGALADTVSRALTTTETDATRAHRARHYLGNLSTPPVERFVAEVDRTLAHVQSTRTPRELLTVPPAPAEVTE